MPTAHAGAVLSIPHLLATAIRLLRLRSAIHVPTFRQFGLASAIGGLAASIGVTIGTFLGVTVLRRIPRSLYRRLVGGRILLLGISLFVTAF